MNTVDRIAFEKPDLPELVRQYTVVDMHFHSHYSDGADAIPDIADHAAQLGIGVAVTDHNDIRGALEISRYRRVMSIPGIEVTSKEGSHLLVYFYRVADLKSFYRNDIEPFMGPDVMSSTGLKMEEIVKRARQYATIVIFPHPYCAAYTGVCNSYFSPQRLEKLYKMVDGVEVINAENLNKWNLRCALLGFNLNKSISAGSDGHKLANMGKSVTVANCRRDRESFLDAVKEKKTKAIGKEIDILKKMSSNGIKLKTNLKNTPDLVEKNIRYGYTVINNKSKNLRENMRKKVNGKLKGNGVQDIFRLNRFF